MRYRIAAVGRVRRGFVKQGCAHYLERLTRLARAEVVEVREGAGGADGMRAEAEALRARSAGHVIALTERGRAFRTRALADHVSALELAGTSQVTLCLGGADGLDRELERVADERWRLSELTLPHELARLVLLEQLYRIETIRAGHPYHRDDAAGLS